jgi:3-isopropylmalate dehydrogenase
MTRAYRITLLPGDGVGPEVTGAARRVLDAVGKRFGRQFAFDEALIGGAAIDAHGDPLPQATLASCLQADAVFLGAVGGPRWDSAPKRPEQGLLGLRKALGVFINVRPLRVFSPLAGSSPLRRELAEDVDLVIFRELIGGSYFGEKRRTPDSASDLCVYTAPEIERIAVAAFAAARARRGKLTSVDKANVMETGRLWRETVTRVHRERFADVVLEHMLVDAMAMQLVRQPRAYDVILTENMFGDILSDQASAIAGSIGLAPSASLGAGGPGLFEPVHGSAPDIAGQDLANPIGAILSAALLLEHGLGLGEEAKAVEAAVDAALEDGARTIDLGGSLSCSQMGAAIVDRIGDSAAASPWRVQMHWG